MHNKYIYIHIFRERYVITCTMIYIYVYITCTSNCIFIYMYRYINMCAYWYSVYRCINLCIPVNMYIHIYIYIYIYMCVCKMVWVWGSLFRSPADSILHLAAVLVSDWTETWHLPMPQRPARPPKHFPPPPVRSKTGLSVLLRCGMLYHTCICL